MDDVSVLIVDDSALMRNLITRIVDSTNGLKVVDKAMNGAFALDKIPLCNPDIIVLDIEMPVMNGIEFLKERRLRNIDIPVVVLSSIAKEGARVTFECLELGASDFVTKPSGADSADIGKVASRLGELLISYGSSYKRRKKRASMVSDTEKRLPKNQPVMPRNVYKTKVEQPVAADFNFVLPSSVQKENSQNDFQKNALSMPKKIQTNIEPLRQHGKVEVIAIGISTGGPNALREVFSKIDPNLKQPVLVVQHMPAGFTEEFAQSLNNICPLEVKEACDGDVLKPGRVLIAPGNKHIFVEQKTLACIVRLSDDEQRNGHRPSADYLFESVAKVFQNRALGVIMTGMGRDGASQLAELRRQGSFTIGQDEESCIVYGMPKVAYELGAVEIQVSLSQMAETISRIARENS